jgi:hypothetical protein
MHLARTGSLGKTPQQGLFLSQRHVGAFSPNHNAGSGWAGTVNWPERLVLHEVLIRVSEKYEDLGVNFRR